MATTITNRGLEIFATEDASAMDIRTAVFVGTVPTVATIRDWNFLQDVIDSALTEAAATNYARQDLATVAATESDASDNLTWSAAAPTISSVGSGETWSCVAHYKYNASDSAAELIAVDEPASTQATNGGDITLPAFLITLAQA